MTIDAFEMTRRRRINVIVFSAESNAVNDYERWNGKGETERERGEDRERERSE